MCARRINPGIWLDDLVTTPLKQRTFRSKFPSQNCAEILTTSCEQAVSGADRVSHRVRYRIIPDGGEINSAVSPSEEKKKGFSGNRITQSPLLSSRKKCPLPAEFIKICERFPLVNFAAMAHVVKRSNAQRKFPFPIRMSLYMCSFRWVTVELWTIYRS